MKAVLLSVLLLIFFSFLGIIAISIASRGRAQSRRALFLAPGVGLGITVLQLYIASRLGFPINEVANYLLVFSLLATAGLMVKQSVRKDSKLVVLILPLFIFGMGFWWPLMRLGFDWLSFGNDDMFNYVLGAQRFQDFGFSDPPNANLSSGIDYSQGIYTLHYLVNIRPGSELTLAFFSSIFQLNPLQVFMPLMACLAMILNLATLTLLPEKYFRNWKSLLLPFLILNISSLITLPVFYQLIAQVGGLAILVCTISLFYHAVVKSDFALALPVILTLSLLIFYTEAIPFLILTILIYSSIHLIRDSRQRTRLMRFLILGTVLALLVLNSRFINTIKFLLIQTLSGTSESNKNEFFLFPYFLRGTGPALLFGGMPLNWSTSGLTGILASIFGILLVTTILCLLLLSIRNWTLGDTALALILSVHIISVFALRDFASFKSAMFVQPFLWIFIIKKIGDHFDFNREDKKIVGKKVPLIILSIIVTMNFFTTIIYGQISLGKSSSSGFAELKNASGSNLFGQLEKVKKSYRPDMGTLISTANSPALAKLEMIALKGIPVIFPSMNFVGNFNTALQNRPVEINDSDVENQTIIPANAPVAFNQHKLRFDQKEISFDRNSIGFMGYDNWYLDYLEESRVTRPKDPSGQKGFLLSRNPPSHLFFISSNEGNSYFMSRRLTALYQPEEHPFIKQQNVFAVAHELLFEVDSRMDKGDFVIDLDSTLLTQHNRKIPRLDLYGKKKWTWENRANGQARITFSNVEPRVDEDGRRYFLLKIGNEAKTFPNADTRFGFLNRGIPLDGRAIGAHVFNVRYLNTNHKNYAKQNSLPFSTNENIAIKGFSGVFSDGWTEPTFRLSGILLRPKNGILLMFENPKTSNLEDGFRYKINDEKWKKIQLKPGINRIVIPMMEIRKEFELIIDVEKTILGVGDERLAGVVLKSIQN